MKREYKLTKVTRFVLTEYQESDTGNTGFSRPICEFDHEPYAADVCKRLNSAEDSSCQKGETGGTHQI